MAVHKHEVSAYTCQIKLKQGSQTQIAPRATLGLTRQPVGRIITQTQQ